jgi:hypothetical protein
MAASSVVGRSAKLYYNSATHATPTWVLIDQAIDVSVPMSKGKADVSCRASSYRKYGAGLKEIRLEFGYLHQNGADTVFDALLASYISDTPIQLAAMDVAIATSGAQGLRAYFFAADMSQGQEMEDGVKFNFVFEHARFIESSAVIDPSWYEVA